jgi:hypothetical protein
MKVLNNPSVVVGPNYTAKAIDLCVDNDLVCDAHGTSFSAHNEYVEDGLVDQGAAFVASQLQASWAADVPVPVTPPSGVPVPAAPPSGAPIPSPHLPSVPLTAPGPTTVAAPTLAAGPLA